MNAKNELVERIKKFLHEDGKTIEFSYDWVELTSQSIGQLAHIVNNIGNQKAEVSAFTTNNTTKETFLLKSVIADTHVECLQKILTFLEKESQTLSTFTVNWTKRENGRLGSYNTSYFSCHDIVEVINKFFTGKNVRDYVIYNIKLNPIA